MLNQFNSFESPCSSNRNPDAPKIDLPIETDSQSATFVEGISGFTNACSHETENMDSRVLIQKTKESKKGILINLTTNSARPSYISEQEWGEQ
ncbi:hypothetical protein KC669_04605 [Candidatus Dojkabacteria bacterium]|uniref:Uncharacterized protein n=1 Tax=Candidatus Dojkabacteria bacterium TaxID=2099670 RepID=A0A955LAQ1_9BACT|nr:hypothetical protein [Candidatus Dojkabacteria bacterium]